MKPDSRFSEINSKYQEYYNSLMKQGRLPVKDTGIGFWGPSVSSEVYEAFKKLGLSKCKSFVDLGSGDGKVTLLAALFCKSALGIEYDKELHEKAIDIKGSLTVNNADFVKGNFMNHDLSRYDTIFCAPDKPMERGLGAKLEKELNGNLIVQGHHFHPLNLKKKKSVKVNDMLFTVYSK